LQVRKPPRAARVINVSGGLANSISLAQLSQWCASRFARHTIGTDTTPRRYDVPWLVLDSAQAEVEWNWRTTAKLESILEEIASHAERHPEWLDISKGT